MALIQESSRPVFDTTQIERGHLLYAKHRSWDEGKGGIVTRVSEDEITVQFHPGIGNVTNHFFIPAKEVAAGEWLVRWSADLSEVKTTEDATTGETEDLDREVDDDF